MDPCSFTNANDFQAKSVHFDWSIDFDKKEINGAVTQLCKLMKDGVKEFIFDTRWRYRKYINIICFGIRTMPNKNVFYK